MKSQLGDKERLNHILEAIAFIKKHTAGISREQFDEHELLPFAIAKNIEIIGEAANNITEATKALAEEIEWHKIIATRHIFVHAYHEADWDIVWRIIKERIPELEQQVNKLMAALNQ